MCSIKRKSRVKEESVKEIISFGAVSIAIDWIGYNMYWMDTSKGLRVTDINGLNTVLLQPMSKGQFVVVDSLRA